MKISYALLIGLPLTFTTLNAFSAATWIDNRLAHTTASEKTNIKSALGIFLITAQGFLHRRCMI